VLRTVLVGSFISVYQTWPLRTHVSLDDIFADGSLIDGTLASANSYGKSVSLSDLIRSKAVAIVFLGSECPGETATGLGSARSKKAIVIWRSKSIGITRTLKTVDGGAAFRASSRKSKLPMLKGTQATVADAMGAHRTPEFT